MNNITKTLFPPNSPQSGDIWINPYTQAVHTYDGKQWVSVTINGRINLIKIKHTEIDTPEKAYERAMKIL